MKQVIEKVKSANTISLFLLLYIVLCLVFVPKFGTAYNVKNILGQVCVLLTVSCGVHYTVLNGGTDFSSTSIIALTSVIGASIMSETQGLLAGKWFAIPVAIVVMILIGLAIGIINGLSIVTFKMPSFIVTMAMQMIGAGLALLYTKGKTIGGLPSAFTKLGTGHIGIFPYALFIAAAIVLVTHMILKKTKLGRQIYSVGTNPKTSRVSGISVKSTIIKLYIISGLCAACAGVLMLAQMESGAASFASNLFIDIMTSIIIGGTSPIGGRGKITDTAMGVFFVILINVSMNLMGVPWFVISIVKGAIILVAASIELATKSKTRTA